MGTGFPPFSVSAGKLERIHPSAVCLSGLRLTADDSQLCLVSLSEGLQTYGMVSGLIATMIAIRFTYITNDK